MYVDISDSSDDALSYIADHIRDQDRVEIEALRGPGVDCRSLIHWCAQQTAPHPLVYSYRGVPAFACGVVRPEDMPHLGHAWGFGTDKAWRVIPEAGFAIRNSLKPWLIANGVRRVQVTVLASNKSSMTWLSKYMGARHECALPQFGRRGEPFAQLAWTIEDE